MTCSPRNGDEALALVKTDAPIDLLLTDIVMPGSLDGFALSRAAMAVRPNLKILHVTGYAQHLATGRHGPESGAVIAKPYRMEELRVYLAGLLAGWAVERNPKLRRLHRYWLAKRGTLPWPDRRSIDPADLVDILPHLGIVEIVGDGGERRFRYRLVGTAIVEAYGRDSTGRFVEETLTGAYREFVLGLLNEVVTTGRGIYAASAFRLEDSGLSAERIFLPLSVDGEAIRQIIVCHTLDWSHRPSVTLAIAEQAEHRTDTIERLN